MRKKYCLKVFAVILAMASLTITGCSKSVPDPAPTPGANEVKPGQSVNGHSAEEMNKVQEQDDKSAKLKL